MSERNIHQRLAAVMKKVTYIQKEKKQGMRYSIVSHDAVTALCRPALLEEGIVYYPIKTTPSQVGNRAQAHMVIRFVNVDDPNDHIEVETFGHGIDDQDKGPGKAMSYATKYALLKTLGLETGDDPELDQNVKHKVEDDLPSLSAYVDSCLAKVDTLNERQRLIDWWQAERPMRTALGIREEPSDPVYAKLYDAYKRRGTEISMSKDMVRTSSNAKAA